MSIKVLFLVACTAVAALAAPQGVVTQQVRLPNLDSAHITVQRLGGNFAYTVADSGPVHGLVHYVPTLQYVPVAPAGLQFAQQQAAAAPAAAAAAPAAAPAPVAAAPAAAAAAPQVQFFHQQHIVG